MAKSTGNKRPTKIPVKTEEIKINQPKMKSTINGLVELPDREVKIEKRKFIKVFENESPDKFKEMGDRVFNKELKWSHYGTENLLGVHYYLILKSQTI
jgi:hypothetical protein